MSSTRSVPEGRYGSARKASRTPRGWRLLVLTLAGAALIGVITYVAYTNIGGAPIEAQRVSFTERPGNAMSVTLDVTRDDPSRPTVCIVRVRDISGAESGRREVYVEPGVERLSTVVRSISRPVTADIFGCSYTVPEYLSRA